MRSGRLSLLPPLHSISRDIVIWRSKRDSNRIVAIVTYADLGDLTVKVLCECGLAIILLVARSDDIVCPLVHLHGVIVNDRANALILAWQDLNVPHRQSARLDSFDDSFFCGPPEDWLFSMDRVKIGLRSKTETAYLPTSDVSDCRFIPLPTSMIMSRLLEVLETLLEGEILSRGEKLL